MRNTKGMKKITGVDLKKVFQYNWNDPALLKVLKVTEYADPFSGLILCDDGTEFESWMEEEVDINKTYHYEGFVCYEDEKREYIEVSLQKLFKLILIGKTKTKAIRIDGESYVIPEGYKLIKEEK